jgi:hypothetical protein
MPSVKPTHVIMLNLVQIISAAFSLQLGHLDSDLDHLVYGLYSIHET